MAQATAPQAAPAAEPAKESKRDLFRRRMSKRYPDLNLDDEDAYYDQMGKAFDEYEGYEKNSKQLTDRMQASPAFRDKVIAAGKQDDFDPIIYLTEQFAEQMQDEVKKYKDAMIPAIILIPGKSGSLGIGMQNITDSVERAVGADIL